jgi:hypothetical protein
MKVTSEWVQSRLLTLYVFEGFFGKLFVLFFVCGKTTATAVFLQEHTTYFLHEALWGKGFKVNTLGAVPAPLRLLLRK